MTDTPVHIPVLRTERLVLRAPRIDDLEVYAAFGASPRAVGVGGTFSRYDAFTRICALLGHWQLRGYGRWMVADPETDRALGIVGLYYPESWPEPEIGWTVFDGAEGRGIAFEAAQAARSYAYDVLGWDSVISCIMADNSRSQALARRMSCTQEPAFQHPEYGPLGIWRHVSRADLSRGTNSSDPDDQGGMGAYA